MLGENTCTDVTLHDKFKSVLVSRTFTAPSISFEAVRAATLVSTNEILANESAQLTVLFTLINIYRNDKQSYVDVLPFLRITSRSILHGDIGVCPLFTSLNHLS